MPGRGIDRFSSSGGVALALLVAGILAASAGAAQAAPAHIATKTQALVVRGSGADRGTFELVIGVRSRSWRAVRVTVYLTGRRPHTLWASPSWGDQTRFRVNLSGERLTVRAVSRPPGVDVHARLVRIVVPTTPQGQNPSSIPVTPPSTLAPTPTTTP